MHGQKCIEGKLKGFVLAKSWKVLLDSFCNTFAYNPQYKVMIIHVNRLEKHPLIPLISHAVELPDDIMKYVMVCIPFQRA